MYVTENKIEVVIYCAKSFVYYQVGKFWKQIIIDI